jgi:hypothetical protein
MLPSGIGLSVKAYLLELARREKAMLALSTRMLSIYTPDRRDLGFF